MLYWKEGGITRFKKEIHVTQLDTSDDEKQFSHLLEEALRKGFYEAFLERELLAQKRAREISILLRFLKKTWLLCSANVKRPMP